jgi:hypothetical protein
MEDVFAGDGGVGVVRAELLYGGVFEVREWETLDFLECQVERQDGVRHQSAE